MSKYLIMRCVKVPLLLRLGEDSRALQRAVDSGDTDLVYLVLFSLYRRLALKDFIAAISSRPKVQKLFLEYCTHVVRPLCLFKLGDAADLLMRQNLPFLRADTQRHRPCTPLRRK